MKILVIRFDSGRLHCDKMKPPLITLREIPARDRDRYKTPFWRKKPKLIAMLNLAENVIHFMDLSPVKVDPEGFIAALLVLDHEYVHWTLRERLDYETCMRFDNLPIEWDL